MEALLARCLLLLVAALALFCIPALAAKVPLQCEAFRAGQAGRFQDFLADAQDAMLLSCQPDAVAGAPVSQELRGPRRWAAGVCSFDAVSLPGLPTGSAGDILADMPRAHVVYMRVGGKACPPQDDPTYTRTETQYGAAFADQFRWSMQAWVRLRADSGVIAADLSAARGGLVKAMLERNRLLPVLVTAIAPEAPSLRTLLHDQRVTLSIEAPQDPDPAQRGVTYTVTLEPTLGGFDVTGAGVAQ